MRVLFQDLNWQVVSALRAAFAGAGNHEFVVEPFDPKVLRYAEAVVAPGNSFGIMDGGYDLVLRNSLPNVQEIVQQSIVDKWGSELPVGACVHAFDLTVNPAWQVLYVPTMRVPEPVRSSFNAYFAFRAALVAARQAGMQTIVCPGLCTATGKMEPETMATQMRLAWDSVMEGVVLRWPQILEHHRTLRDVTG